jgi:TorA maturation chaperone TorD
MMTAPPDGSVLLAHFRNAVAEDLRGLAWLQAQEVTKEVLAELQQVNFPDNLGLRLQSKEGREACDLMRKAIAELPASLNESLLDELAADFTAIFLNNHYHTSPYESVWLTDEALVRQAPMMQMREWYKKYDLIAKDWKKRPDDYLALEVELVAHLMALDEKEDTLKAVAQFLDEHLLRWVKPFATRVVSRCATPFYAGVTILTAQYLEELRDLLANILDDPRPSEADVEKRMRAQNRPVGLICTPARELIAEEMELRDKLEQQVTS